MAISNQKLIHAYGPKKKTVVMGIDETIERIKRTANLNVIGLKDPKRKGSFSSLHCPKIVLND